MITEGICLAPAPSREPRTVAPALTWRRKLGNCLVALGLRGLVSDVDPGQDFWDDASKCWGETVSGKSKGPSRSLHSAGAGLNVMPEPRRGGGHQAQESL